MGDRHDPAASDGRGRRTLGRRQFLMRSARIGLGLSAAGIIAYDRLRGEELPYEPDAFAPIGRSPAALVRVADYEHDLEGVVEEGLRTVSADRLVEGRRVLLKPNLVEFDEGEAINTDPRLIGAAVVALRRLGASSVTVGEGPGHRRDTDYVVSSSGLWDVLREVEAPFVDLNVAPITRTTLHSRYTSLGELWLPKPLVDADVVVSMPKMKSHHWVGVTLSMKNLFGCLPGRIYGWPKNVLHWQGISESILDIAGAVAPAVQIVDGIVGMEGDGPIMGTAIPAGHLVFGVDPVATDATTARAMGFDPERISYLAEAGRFLGQADLARVDQRGEDPERTGLAFEVVEEFAYLRYGSHATAGERDPSGG